MLRHCGRRRGEPLRRLLRESRRRLGRPLFWIYVTEISNHRLRRRAGAAHVLTRNGAIDGLDVVAQRRFAPRLLQDAKPSRGPHASRHRNDARHRRALRGILFAERFADRETALLMPLADFPPDFALVDAFDAAADGLVGILGSSRSSCHGWLVDGRRWPSIGRV